MRQQDLSETRPRNIIQRSSVQAVIIPILIVAFVLLVGVILGCIVGIWQGRVAVEKKQALSEVQILYEQYTLGLENMDHGEYELARQRFDYILSLHPDFPGASENLLQVLNIIYATRTPSPIPPTSTATMEADNRPSEEMFQLVNEYFNIGDWYNVIDTIIRLREENPKYQVVLLDGLLFTALRNQGIQKIRGENNLAGGIYDLALAERFGPLDIEANNWRNLARVYLIGLSFWEVFPERSVYYFSQVAGAAPYLMDASGWTARERYRVALLQYADFLAGQGDWCDAQRQYEQSLSIGVDERVQATVQYVMIKCSPPTETPTITSTQTGTPTPTETLISTGIFTVTQTQTIYPSTQTPTGTLIATPTQTGTLIPTGILTATPTQTVSISTQTPTVTPTATPTTSPQPNPLSTPSPTATSTNSAENLMVD